MALFGLTAFGLALFFVPGLVLLACGAAFKKRRRGLLISGVALCAPMAAFYLLGAVGAIVGYMGGGL